MVSRSAAKKRARRLFGCFVLLAISWTIALAQALPNANNNKEDHKASEQSTPDNKSHENGDPMGRSTPHGTARQRLDAASGI